MHAFLGGPDDEASHSFVLQYFHQCFENLTRHIVNRLWLACFLATFFWLIMMNQKEHEPSVIYSSFTFSSWRRQSSSLCAFSTTVLKTQDTISFIGCGLQVCRWPSFDSLWRIKQSMSLASFTIPLLPAVDVGSRQIYVLFPPLF